MNKSVPFDCIVISFWQVIYMGALATVYPKKSRGNFTYEAIWDTMKLTISKSVLNRLKFKSELRVTLLNSEFTDSEKCLWFRSVDSEFIHPEFS